MIARSLLLLLAASPAFGFSARAVSMGNAFTAVGDDADGMTFNPANSGQVREPQAMLGYAREHHVPGGVVNDDVIGLAGVFPVNQELIRGGVGLRYLYEDQRTVDLTNRTLAVNYGTRGLFELEEHGVDLGLTTKLIGQGGLKLGFDLGAIARWKDRTRVGLSILNASNPSGSPAAFRLGVAEQVRGFTLALDLSRTEPSAGRRGATMAHAGLERWWPTARRGALALRSGLQLGGRTRTFNWGTGWRILGGQFDAGMVVPLHGPRELGYALTTVMRFGASDPEREYERMLSQEVGYRKDLTEALEAGEVKQWRLGEELRKLRDEMELLRDQLIDKTASEAEARARLRELEQRRKEAAARFDKLQADRAKTRSTLFKEDWQSYQRLRLSGAPDSVLLDNVRRILREYKDAGVDLSEANQELLRLLRAQPAQ